MKRVVVVLGAHRAGTSLAMQVLCRAGVRTGSDLMAPDEWNAGGYAEQRSIMEAHEAALEAIERPWNVPAGLLPIEPEAWDAPGLAGPRELCFAEPDDGRLDVDDTVAGLEAAEQRLARDWVSGRWRDCYHVINAIDREGEVPSVWRSRLGGVSSRCLMLQPPNTFTVEIPDGGPGELHFAVALHPDVWERDDSGPCRFEAEIDQRVRVTTELDPVGLPADRRWHEFEIAIPENCADRHTVTLETAALGAGESFRWALWREPVFKRR